MTDPAPADRTMTLQRVIDAPVSAVWGVWNDPEALPLWWGPHEFSCGTARIDLRQGGEWVFDMIAPDGTVFPNHHRYTPIDPGARIDYTLHWGENRPEHANASAVFEDLRGRTGVPLSMTTVDDLRHRRGIRKGQRPRGGRAWAADPGQACAALGRGVTPGAKAGALPPQPRDISAKKNCGAVA